MRHAFSRSSLPGDVLSEILIRLWQIESRGVELLDRWGSLAVDSDIKAGLHAQVADERRHLRLLTDELRRRGCRQPTQLDHVVVKAFALVQAQPSDALKICAFHRGIKAATRERLYRLLPYADKPLLEVLEQIVRDDDRHLHWADMRLRGLSGREVRQCNALLGQVLGAMDAVWGPLWRHLSAAKLSKLE